MYASFMWSMKVEESTLPQEKEAWEMDWVEREVGDELTKGRVQQVDHDGY